MPFHNRTIGDEVYLTPPGLLKTLGPFDLDPCSPCSRPWDTAAKHYTIEDDGLSQPWGGRVWLNPPYGAKRKQWLRKLSEHGNGIALIFASTETRDFFNYVWPKADGIFFCQGRLTFHRVTGQPCESNGGAASCLVAYGRSNADVLQGLTNGRFVRLR